MVCVIIPTLDEEQTLQRTLTAVNAAAGDTEFGVIVADGGSTDGTVEVARARGCVCLPSPHAQRATQMNLGGAHAKGETLLFLHADTLLPPGALGLVEAACQHPGVSGGGFARRYDSPLPLARFDLPVGRGAQPLDWLAPGGSGDFHTQAVV